MLYNQIKEGEEEEYLKAYNEKTNSLPSTPYLEYLRKISEDMGKVHNGYFSIDKKTGKSIDSELKKGAEFSDDISAYDLILKNKERLLSFEEPTRFIFSVTRMLTIPPAPVYFTELLSRFRRT